MTMTNKRSNSHRHRPQTEPRPHRGADVLACLNHTLRRGAGRQACNAGGRAGSLERSQRKQQPEYGAALVSSRPPGRLIVPRPVAAPRPKEAVFPPPKTPYPP